MLLAAAGFVAGRLASAQTGDWVNATANDMHYKVLLPDNYNATKRYPVLLYLHQLDMGDFPEALVRQVDPWFNSSSFRLRHPCIVVMPLLDQTGDTGGRLVNFGGKRQGETGEQNAIVALQQVTRRYSVDPNRIYVTGNSMGGMGAWQMLLDYNSRTGTKGRIFAAGMPLAGTNQTVRPAEAASALRDVPIWTMHGAKDNEVSLDWDRAMVRLMAASPTYRYTEIPDGGHDIWDAAYRRTDIWDWLFNQKS